MGSVADALDTGGETRNKEAVGEGKEVEALQETVQEEEGLKKNSVSLFGVCVMAICCAAPALVIGSTAGYIMERAALAVPLTFLIATILLLLVSTSYIQLSGRYAVKGGTYAFVQRVFGGQCGFWTAWLYLAVLISIGCVTSIFAIFLHAAIPAIPLWFAGFIVLFPTFIIGWRGADFSTKGMIIIWVVQMLLIVVPAFIPFITRAAEIPDFFTHAVSVAWTPTTTLAGLTMGVILAAWGFAGFETPAYMAEEIKGGPRAVAIAIPVSIIAIGVTYFAVSWLWIAGTTPADLAVMAGSDIALNDFLALFPGGAQAAFAVSISICIGCFGGVCAWINSLPRMAMNLAKAGFIPKPFAKLNKHKAPGLGVICCIAIWIPISYIGIYGSTDMLINIMALFLSVSYIFVSLSNIKDSLKDWSLKGIFMGKIFPLLGIAAMILLISSQPLSYLLVAGGWCVAGVVLTLILQKVKGKEFFQKTMD
jgi:amino acid transporter